MRLARTILLLISTLCVGVAWSQPLSQKFNDAVAAGDLGQAHSLLARMSSEIPGQLYLVADAAESLLLHPDAQRAQTDTLLAVYESGTLGPEPGRWQFRKAALAVRFPDRYLPEGLNWAYASVQSDPLYCPLDNYRFWGELLRYSNRTRQTDPVQLANQWLLLERSLIHRKWLNPQQERNLDGLLRELHHHLLGRAPACDALSLSPVTPAERNAALLYWGMLRCDKPGTATQADRLAELVGESWSWELLANRAQFSGNIPQALGYLDRALKAEENPLFRAEYFSRKALLLSSQGEFRQARNHLRQAQEFAPERGDLYLQLADLYLQGAGACSWSGFDAKAVYWLAIDCCQKARSTSPHLAPEADERIYAYRQKMPSPEEVRFKGLQAGDTWPLPCWMGTVTTVKIN